jgi:hypothetical protein
MPLTLWNQQLNGNQVPAGHAFSNVINLYSNFRNTINGDITAFGNWLIQDHGYAKGGVNTFLFPLTPNQLNIAALDSEQVQFLANNPQGRFARIFLHRWYRCNLQSEFPTCLADVFIVGYIRQQEGLQGQDLKNRITELGYAGNANASAQTLINVGNGIGQHFGFLNDDRLPTAFFNSFFQDTYLV